MPLGASAPACTIFLNTFDGSASLLGRTERYERLIELDILEYLESRRRQAIGEKAGLAAVALDQVPRAAAAERTHRRLHLNAAGAAGGFGGVVPGLAGLTQ